jgi:hypothetical protein
MLQKRDNKDLNSYLMVVVATVAYNVKHNIGFTETITNITIIRGE